MLSQVKGALVLDAGNALFMAPGLTDDKAKARAAFVLKQMGALGTRAMAPGFKDLNLGVDFLKAQAKEAGVQVLSANLMDKDVRPFAAGAVFTVGGVKVGVLGLSPEGPLGSARGNPLAASARRELPLLKDADVKVVLAAVPYQAALALAESLAGEVDFVIQSQEGRPAMPPQPVKQNFVLASGLRGQAMGQLDVKVSGRGPMLDEADGSRAQEQLAFVDRQIEELAGRARKAKDGPGRKALEQTENEMRRRRATLQRAADATKVEAARSFLLQWRVLDRNVVDEPAMKAKVLKIEPTYAGSH